MGIEEQADVKDDDPELRHYTLPHGKIPELIACRNLVKRTRSQEEEPDEQEEGKSRQKVSHVSFDPGRAARALDFKSVLRRTDLLFINEGELRDYFKITPTEKALKTFAKTIPGIVVVKKGKKGSVATDGFEYCTSQVFDVTVVDTLGAGDAFAAGFVTAWTRSERIEQALHVGNAVAALTITKMGAQNGQPTLDETARLLKKHSVSIDSILRTFKSGKKKKKGRK